MEATIVNGAWKGHLGRGLAPRELQYLLSAAQGKTAKEIARLHGVAACTVLPSVLDEGPAVARAALAGAGWGWGCAMLLRPIEVRRYHALRMRHQWAPKE